MQGLDYTNNTLEKRFINTKNLDILLKNIDPISLDEMDKVKLMNRTDTKYLTKIESLYQLLPLLESGYNILKINNYLINPYKTLYLDTFDSKMYTDHHNGHKTRKKVRLRTYLNSDTHFLEVKHKNNKGITKKTRILIPNYEYSTNKDSIYFLKENIHFEVNELSPHLESLYERITLTNKEKTERLTIDLNLRFKNHRTGNTNSLEKLIIIELKQDSAKRSHTKELLNNLKIRPTRLSKYCIGSVMTNPDLKYNRFKPRLIQINKLLQF